MPTLNATFEYSSAQGGDHVPARIGVSRPGRPGSSFQEAALAWVSLVLAGILEVVWAAAMKQSQGFTRPLPSLICIVGVIAGLALLSWSMRVLPLGTAYMVWTGIGAIGAFLVGVFVLGEALTPMRTAAALLIVSGLVLMKLSGQH